jgi:hypothetical protein
MPIPAPIPLRTLAFMHVGIGRGTQTDDEDAKDVFGYVVLYGAGVLLILGILTTGSPAIVRGLGAAVLTFAIAAVVQLGRQRGRA